MNFPLETSLFWGPLLPVKHGWICKLSSEANISEAKIIGFEDSKPEPRSLFFHEMNLPAIGGSPMTMETQKNINTASKTIAVENPCWSISPGYITNHESLARVFHAYGLVQTKKTISNGYD